ncbi:hypothetical protein CGC56_07120 [Capnocytophaga canimorsus]|uniref:Uncharacterized protein n=1 Tax=Capnocytophaga canimorsus TaxID=28188 RepID=A0A250G3G7_9FLAO|nr:hypothetical protein [Capnocytophaga canimorsus]ATA91952.1 hypothetical protein CGC56_07120 [Capnocytophaga canimorsus]
MLSKWACQKAPLVESLRGTNSKEGGYTPQNAQEQVNIRKERFAVNRKFISKVVAFVEEKIRREQWSPQQIVGYCKKHEIVW